MSLWAGYCGTEVRRLRTILEYEEVVWFMAFQITASTSRAEPAPLGASAQAGPLVLTVNEVVTGPAATDQVLAANSHNEPPAEGIDYVLARVQIVNEGDRPVVLGEDDFAFTGTSGIVRRSLGLFPPEPSLNVLLGAGETIEGWVAGAAESDEDNLLLLFNNRALTGNWADAVLALQDGASVSDADSQAVAVNEAGIDPGTPAGLNEPVVTQDWAVELVRVAYGQEVYDLYSPSDYRTRALGDSVPGLIPSWIALLVQVTNNQTGGRQAHFPATAFRLAYAGGEPVQDVRMLTPPRPDASGGYFPGASRQGWFAIEIPGGYGGSLLRFQPLSGDDDVRYLTWSDGAAPSSGAEPTPPPPDEEFAVEALVVVTDDQVNLRAEPSVEAEIVTVLAAGDELTITGSSVDADGFRWYPVTNAATGDEGFVASNFIRESSS